MRLKEAIQLVTDVDKQVAKEAQQRWDQIAKPLGGLGVLEEDIVRIAAVQRKADISLKQKMIAVMCADNGIVEEGVTQTGREVTGVVAEQMAMGRSCVCYMAGCAGAKVFPVDVGIAKKMDVPGLLNKKVMPGTKNFLQEPAMSRSQAVEAVEAGIETALMFQKAGCQLAGSGEMGIGNTTTASAVIAVLLEERPDRVTGRGAGLCDQGYQRKIQVIEQGICLRRPNPSDGLDVLSKVGGLDLAALAGFYIGCALSGIPVVLDGLITGAAALAALRICPGVKNYFLASHLSAEPAGALVLKALGLKPAIEAGLCLGEGTGAAALFPLLDMAASVYQNMGSFAEIQVEPYQRFL